MLDFLNPCSKLLFLRHDRTVCTFQRTVVASQSDGRETNSEIFFLRTIEIKGVWISRYAVRNGEAGGAEDPVEK